MKLKWFFSLVNILAVGLILVSLLALLMVVLTPQGQVPQVMGFSLLRVLSGSMEPEIPEQSMLLIRATEPEALAVGDVISFFSPDPSLNGALNTHRIAAIVQAEGDLEFVTKLNYIRSKMKTFNEFFCQKRSIIQKFGRWCEDIFFA